MARPRPVADLVPLEAGAGEAAIGQLVHGGGAIVVLVESRAVAPASRAGRRREMVATRSGDPFRVRVIEGEGVQRQVIRLERERRVERGRPGLERSARHVVEQVQADRADSSVPGGPNRHGDIGGRVAAAEVPQLPGIHRLRADRESRHARIAEGAEVTALVGSRVRLDGDLGAGR
jgi:hypothetical protein